MTRPASILLVDDDTSMQRALVPLFRSRGYDARVAATAGEARAIFERDRPDLVVLDLGLPDQDGTTVCEWMRARGETPIIVLSARDAERDKIGALDLGADDFVVKPFSAEELLARIRTALRRAFRGEEPGVGRLEVGDLAIDFDRRRVCRGADEIRLTPKEFALIALLARHAGRVLTHRTILRTIWGAHAVDQPEHLWVLVRQLRRKIEVDPAAPRYIQSEPWVGYRIGD